MWLRVSIVCSLLFARIITLPAQVLYTEKTSNPGLFSINGARGVAVADFDNDGDEDFFVTGRPSRFYRNDGNWNFTDVTASAGMGGTEASVAVWTDLNNDGWLDLVSSSWTSSDVYINNTDGTFREGFSPGIARRQSLLAGDLNHDGWVDIFSANFRDPHELLLNAGDGLLIDDAKDRGVATVHTGMGGVLVDHDLDGDLDIYLVYDTYEPTEIFENDGSGNFSDASEKWGLKTESQAMGIDEADINGDGKPDYYITNLFDNYLFESNSGDYNERAMASGSNDYGMSWGIRLFDADNDADIDIYVHNAYGFSSYISRLFINQSDNTFEDIAEGTPLENKLTGYGMATADLNNDGLQDIILVNGETDKAVRIFQNETVSANNWLQLDLVGSTVNAFALGARISVFFDGKSQVSQVRAGTGWASQNGFRQYFGLGQADKVDSIIVNWPDGTNSRHYPDQVNKRYILSQSESLLPYTSGTYNNLITSSDLGSLPLVALPPLPDASKSIARQWNEALLFAIRNDLARPTVHARNLFHLSVAMYDAWAAFGGNTYLLGKERGSYKSQFAGIVMPEDAQIKAISYAAYRLLDYRFQNSPGSGVSRAYFRALMERLGYDVNYTSSAYLDGDAAGLGNYIGREVINFGKTDGSNESNNYSNTYYEPVNDPLNPFDPGNPTIFNANRWQPLQLENFIDQSGNADGTTPPFLGPEWGNLVPFALDTLAAVKRIRDGHEYRIFHDPGAPAYIGNEPGLTDPYKWTHTMVSIWGSHLDPHDGVMIDISPASFGNNLAYPSSPSGYSNFYDYFNGGDAGTGYEINPVTGNPYDPQIVPRGDFSRVLAEFWADGPDSETPPGHWFTLLNDVTDHPEFEPRWLGEGHFMNPLEWDVKAYMAMGGAMHDAAVTSWSIKGYYDYVRPISAIRYMAAKGQSSDPDLPSYDPHGLPLLEGFVELVYPGDELQGTNGENVHKIKLYTWRGHEFIDNPEIDEAGVGWILAENWFSYQRPTFVTPPFAGYISGHSTFSSAGAEVLSIITGSEYFPGGLGEYIARKNEFLVFEEGPSMDIKLQWARYRDASDQSSMSRIWGGIHPPEDDIPGRRIGIEIGKQAVDLANSIFNGEVITSLEEQGSSEVIIFPNPLQGNKKLSIRKPSGYSKMTLLDLTGRHIFEEFLGTENEVKVNIPVISPGVYLILISGSWGSETHRLLVR
ncbi:FG-GAP-like repeat-containing protein [Fulvivirga sedimenti]|uniref:FG-GAP-like repeat-containing protein n=1 Tax=Fulvivirga sedimenti TaxID=2879465 RepID=A0A9X1HPL3_9BACT|nr:FG-GAP-like repeat-containing protein [Fulvivirga sedimenti]MCA6074822.1 FG-GAP-like repeat-containing protein [Fulvivirga sedimenti]MCA6075999.1 FG-GAP-like repeat-containing protein [Fulvivirga sedimenti]MCA6077127.1 FG-GAP-like repeat-containing protein [Fulvivirga sedimenti]